MDTDKKGKQQKKRWWAVAPVFICVHLCSSVVPGFPAVGSVNGFQKSAGAGVHEYREVAGAYGLAPDHSPTGVGELLVVFQQKNDRLAGVPLVGLGALLQRGLIGLIGIEFDGGHGERLRLSRGGPALIEPGKHALMEIALGLHDRVGPTAGFVLAGGEEEGLPRGGFSGLGLHPGQQNAGESDDLDIGGPAAGGDIHLLEGLTARNRLGGFFFGLLLRRRGFSRTPGQQYEQGSSGKECERFHGTFLRSHILASSQAEACAWRLLIAAVLSERPIRDFREAAA